jgi:hypothetical protein
MFTHRMKPRQANNLMMQYTIISFSCQEKSLSGWSSNDSNLWPSTVRLYLPAFIFVLIYALRETSRETKGCKVLTNRRCFICKQIGHFRSLFIFGVVRSISLSLCRLPVVSRKTLLDYFLDRSNLLCRNQPPPHYDFFLPMISVANTVRHKTRLTPGKWNRVKLCCLTLRLDIETKFIHTFLACDLV